jgi:hypothetical protein
MARVWISFDEVRSRVRITEIMQVLGVDMAQYVEGPNGSVTGPCCLPCHPIGDPNHRNCRQFRVDRIVDNDGQEIDVFKCFSTDHDVGGSAVTFAKLMLRRSDAAVRYFFHDHWSGRLTGRPPKRESPPAKKEPCEEARIAAEAPTQGVLKAPVSVAGNGEADKELRPMDHFLRLDPDVAYLKQRGLSRETLDRYGVGYASRGRMKGYVCMPVYGFPHPDASPPLVYLGRYAGEDYLEKNKPKYLWGAADFPKSRVLVGLAQAMENFRDRPIVLTEGMFDMLSVCEAGYRHVVTCVGSDLSDEQARLLLHLGHPVVLLFDGDDAGRAGARKAAGKLIRGAFVRAVMLPEGKDPADLRPEELRRHLSFLM